MNPKLPPFASRPGGFTLVEMLVVMAIIAILTALAFSGFRSINSALGLSTATQAVTSELTTARQTALTLDQTVQVRFYQYPDSTGASSTKEYQAMQSFLPNNNPPTSLDKIVFLPPTIMISSSSTYSPPLSGSATAATPPAPPIQANGIGMNYSYIYVNFKSNGTIDPQPASGSWFISLYEKRYGTSGTPVNYTTVNVDPQNGRLRMFQP